MEEQPQQPQYGFQKSKADQARGSAPWFLLPFMILIRPGRFMLSWGIHANIFWILLAAWMIGSSGMINTVVNRTRFSPDSLPISIDSWATVWMIILGFGILRGIISYGIGGLWTWLRLRICGVKGNEWKRSTRIFCLSSLADEVPSLLALFYFTMRHDTLRHFIAQPVGFVNLVAALFMLFAPIIGLVGVLACYKVRVVWATILFFVIPMSWRLGMLGLLGYSLLTSTGSVLLPDTQHPIAAHEGALSFEYPDGWQASIADPDGPRPIEAFIVSEDEMGSLVIRVQPRDEVDLINYDLGILKDLGYTVISETQAPNVRFDNQYGDGVDYIIKAGPDLNNKKFKMLHLLVHFDVDHDVLFRFMATERYWGAALRGWKQILATLAIGDLYQIKPDIENPMTIDREVFSFQAPGNWYLIESERDPFTNLEISAKQFSSFSASIYDRDMTAQAELDMYLNHSIEDQLVSHTEMATWMGLTGVGVQGQLRESLAGYQQFKALYISLADGRLLVVKVYQAETSADLTDPGFELIESTFKLLVEPAPIEP